MRIAGFEINLQRMLKRDRRKAGRHPTCETLYLDYWSPVHLKRGSAEARDISTAGIRFACESNFPKGTPLDLTFRFLPAYALAKTIHVRGNVVRSYKRPNQRRHRLACSFDHLEARHYDEINAFILWLKERGQRFHSLGSQD